MQDFLVNVASDVVSHHVIGLITFITFLFYRLMSKQKKDPTPEIAGNDTPETPETQTENTVEPTETPEIAGQETAEGRQQTAEENAAATPVPLQPCKQCGETTNLKRLGDSNSYVYKGLENVTQQNVKCKNCGLLYTSKTRVPIVRKGLGEI